MCFQEAVKKNMSINVTEVMNTWILQMGYPVVKLTQDGDNVKFSQKRFLFEEPKAEDEIKESPYG